MKVRSLISGSRKTSKAEGFSFEGFGPWGLAWGFRSEIGVQGPGAGSFRVGEFPRVCRTFGVMGRE